MEFDIRKRFKGYFFLLFFSFLEKQLPQSAGIFIFAFILVKLFEKSELFVLTFGSRDF
jgi:hypothetical protein